VILKPAFCKRRQATNNVQAMLDSDLVLMVGDLILSSTPMGI